MAKKYDPDGERTLGVVTKCDDVAKMESSDIVEKAQGFYVRAGLALTCAAKSSKFLALCVFLKKLLSAIPLEHSVHMLCLYYC